MFAACPAPMEDQSLAAPAYEYLLSFMNISIEPCVGRTAVPCPEVADTEDPTGTWGLRHSRIKNWPVPSDLAKDEPIFDIYSRVRDTGMPNMLKAKIVVPSLLKLDIWMAIATGHPDDSIVLNGITYGFPIHYTGDKLDRENKVAHSSAAQFMPHVRS